MIPIRTTADAMILVAFMSCLRFEKSIQIQLLVPTRSTPFSTAARIAAAMASNDLAPPHANRAAVAQERGSRTRGSIRLSQVNAVKVDQAVCADAASLDLHGGNPLGLARVGRHPDRSAPRVDPDLANDL